MAAVLALCAGAGAFLLVSAVLPELRGTHVRSALRADRRRVSAREWLNQAGLADTRPAHLLALTGGCAALGATSGRVLFGATLPALAVGAFAASAAPAAARRRRRTRRARSGEHWPRLIDEVRVLTGSAGRSIPQALFEAGRRAPDELRPAFRAAQREWLLTTDFARTVAVLKAQLADPTADVTCETLLVAHQLGGSDLERRLDALADDRRLDVQDRKDARARQAGVRFARLFVLIVPAGMALAGLSIGTGREAYATPAGQVAVMVGLGMLALCWVWAGRLMRLPAEQRVFP
jgi:tight adherence protein B